MKKNNEKKTNTRLLISPILIIILSLLSVQSFSSETNQTAISQNITELKLLSAELIREAYQTQRIDTKIAEAENHLANQELEQSIMAIDDANQLIILAKETRSSLEKSDDNLGYAEKIGLNTTAAEGYLSLAKQEFIIENYVGTKELNAKNLESLSNELKNNYTELSDGLEKIRNQTIHIGLKTTINEELAQQLKDAQSSFEIKSFIEISQKLQTFTRSIQQLSAIKNEISTLENQNEPAALFNDLFASAKKSIEIGDFDSAQDYAIRIREQLDLRNTLKEKIETTEKLLTQIISQEKTTASEKNEFETYLLKLQTIKKSYYEQNYEKTKNSIDSLNQEIEESITNTVFRNPSGTKNFVLTDYLKSHYKSIIAILIVISAITAFGWLTLKERIYGLRITNYNNKIDAIQNSIAAVQRRYYKEKKISKETYQNLLDNHREALISAKEKLYVLQHQKRR